MNIILDKLKLMLSTKKENCDSKKSVMKNSKGVANSGDKNVIAGRDIILTPNNSNAVEYKELWDKFVRLFSNKCIDFYVRAMETPGLHDKKEVMNKWVTDIHNYGKKIPISHKDKRATDLTTIIEEASETINAYIEKQNEKDLREKLTALLNSLSRIRDF